MLWILGITHKKQEYCRSLDFKSPIGPTKNLERLYNCVVGCSFVWSVATLGITASTHSKFCHADQTRQDQTKWSKWSRWSRCLRWSKWSRWSSWSRSRQKSRRSKNWSRWSRWSRLLRWSRWSSQKGEKNQGDKNQGDKN